MIYNIKFSRFPNRYSLQLLQTTWLKPYSENSKYIKFSVKLSFSQW